MNRYADALPLHLAVRNFDEIVAFSIVLELGKKHYPTKLGFIFNMAKEIGKSFEEVAKIVDNVLCEKNDLKNRTLETLVSLAIDECVPCDVIYIVRRGNPSVYNSVPSPTSGSGDNSNQSRERRKQKRRSKRL